MSIIADIFKGGKTLTYPRVAFLAFAFSMATPSFAAEARSITGVERIVSDGAVSLKVTFEAGKTGDNHALYIAYATEDKGETITNWAELQRGCNVAADATSAMIPVSPLLTGKGYTVCRVFLTTSAAPYDTQIEYLRQSGEQYIDTGIKPDATSVAVMDTKFDSNDPTQQRFFGISSGDDATAVFSFDCYINGKGKFASACKDGKGDWKEAAAFTKDRVRISLSAKDKHRIVITNLVTGAQIVDKTWSTDCNAASVTNLLVFALHTVKNSAASIPADRFAKGARLYSFTMSNSSGVLCDYKPCKFGGRVGVYDAVTDTVIYSASGTDFDAANSGSPVACSLLADETQLAAAPSATGLFFDYTWRGTVANWGDTDVWAKDGANATWSDGNNAIFTNANSAATLAADVNANSIEFRADATIAGTSDLSVKSVSVDSGVSATISAPISSAFEKTGSGTLTLGSSRTNQTMLTEGTLAMANGAMLDWTKFSFGTDPAKPVSLNLGGATLSADLTSCMSATVGGAAGGIVAIDNGVITNTAYLRVWNGSLTLGSDTQVTMDASSAERWVCVGGNNSGDESVTTMDACLILDGASINKSGSKNVLLGIGDFGSYPSKATMIVKNGGKSEIGDTAYVAQGCEGHLIIDGADSLLKAYDIKFCNTSRCEVNENGYVVVTNGGTLAVRNLAYGSGAGEGYFRFDGGTLLATAAVTLLPAHDNLHYIVGEKGGTIDNGGNNITIAKGLSGTGTINLTGSGMTTFAAGVGTECGVSVASGTTLALNGSVTFAGPVVFESGSTLSVTAPSCDKAALAAPLISIKGDMIISIPSQRFADGKYKILEMSDAQFGADVLNCLTLNGGKGDELKKYALSVEGNTIYLEVTGGVESYWVGGVGDNRFSVAANWDNGKVPEDGATLDFSGVASKTQINADVDKVYNTILIPVPSANSFWDYYVQVSGTLHLNTITNATFLSVAADSVLKVDGDVVLNKDAKKLGSTSSKRGCYMFHSNKGRIEIGGNLVNEVTPNNRVLMYISSSPGGVLKMGGVVNNSDKAISLCGNHTTPILCVIGENGLSGKMGFYQYGGSNAEITLKAGDDFAVGIYLTASYPFKFDTSDETGTAHTIILDAEINGSGGVTIVGNGRVVANSSADPGTNVVTVEDGATLAINPGKLITNGKMTVNSGATLSLPQSGAVTLGGDLELADGSTLAFNFTERKVGPLLALASEKSLSFVGEGEKNIAVKVSGDVWPVGGKHILTATGGFKAEGVTVSLAEGAPKWAKGVYVNEDGNIVLDVKPRGTRVIVR